MRATTTFGLNSRPRLPRVREHPLWDPKTGPSRKVKSNRQRVVVWYTGHVQGVGFRYTAREVAEGFDVCGTVRNLGDGRVELVAEGFPSELEAFRQAIRDSGVGPMIRDEAVEWSEPHGDLRGFQILR
ncbi:MAG: acylphosphatase [Nitrospira sp.]|nr:acylphosphatase [Nitrospira sp.]